MTGMSHWLPNLASLPPSLPSHPLHCVPTRPIIMASHTHVVIALPLDLCLCRIILSYFILVAQLVTIHHITV